MSSPLQLSEDQRDCLQEIANIAMGQAGASLAKFLEVFIQLSVPRIRLVRFDDVIPGLKQLAGDSKEISAVRQGFYDAKVSTGLRGEAIVVFTDASFKELADLMAYDGEPDENAETELLLDITNILNGACLSGMAEQLGLELSYTPPSVIGHRAPVDKIISVEQMTWQLALMVEINYRLEHRSFNCDLLLLMPDEAIRAMIAAVDRFMENF